MSKSIITWTIALTVSIFICTGCRFAFYGAVGEQSIGEVTMRTQKADPNMAGVGEIIGTAIKTALK